MSITWAPLRFPPINLWNAPRQPALEESMGFRDTPREGDTYRHDSGRIYTVITVANLDATRVGWKPQVVYRDEDGRVWARPISDFNQRNTKVT